MHEHNVFGRFDISKLIIAAGISVVLSEKENSEEVLSKAGIDINKKWEQFIYKWVEKIVNDEYNKNGRLLRMFIPGNTHTDYGIPREDASSWITDAEEAIIYEKKFAEYTEDRRGRKFPPTFSNRYIAGEEGFDNQLEALEATDMRDNILSKLSGKNDKAVFLFLEQGLSEKEISEKLNFSQQYVGTIIHKIRNLVSQLCLV
jgi:DNA-directed RNA polymerase specialized sigma24 family protein